MHARFAIVATGLKQCLSEEGGADNLDAKKMEKLFLSLARPVHSLTETLGILGRDIQRWLKSTSIRSS